MPPPPTPSCTGQSIVVVIIVPDSHLTFIKYVYLYICIHKQTILNCHFYLLKNYSIFLSKKYKKQLNAPIKLECTIYSVY